MRRLHTCRRILSRYAAEPAGGRRGLGGGGDLAGRRPSSAAAGCSYGGGRAEEERHKVVVIVGATGTGKTKLSIDLARRQAPAEVVNSDKMQVYSGLDVTTNKVTPAERRGVPHHLLGSLDPDAGELSPAEFRDLGGAAVADIVARGRLPIVAGGSNSFVNALLAEHYVPEQDRRRYPFGFGGGRLRYRCCILWVHVARRVLYEHLDRRVDEMLSAGMFEELAENYDPARSLRGYSGPWRAIGVPEFDRFFGRYPPPDRPPARGDRYWRELREKAHYGATVEEIKFNTRLLADAQVGKIERLKEIGWVMRRVDATAAVRAALEAGRGKAEAPERACWEEDVLRPSVQAVRGLLRGDDHDDVEGGGRDRRLRRLGIV